MQIRCEVCGRLLSNINNKHLASHDMTAAQYRSQFPNAPLMSKEHAAKLSARSIASNEHRRGVPRSEEIKQRMREGQAQYNATHDLKRGPMSDNQKKLLSNLAHERYDQGFIHPNSGKHLPDAVKQKISKTLTGRIVGPEIAYKAIETKRQAGYDLAPFRGKHHTDETKTKLSAAIRAHTIKNRLIIRAIMIERMNEANISLLNCISTDLFQLRCNVCGYEFTRTPQCFQPAKFHLRICDQCFPISPVSQQENEVAEFIQQISNTKMLRSDMETLSPLELDIHLPEKNLAIEYCGLYWHNSDRKPYLYHRYKYDECDKKGIRLITIFEDEWVNSRSVVESMLRNALYGATRMINARSCEVREINNDIGIEFLNANHLQGRGRSKVKFGLFFDDELVSVMSFIDSEISHRGNGWEINRFCSKLTYSVRGGASKLFAAFVRKYHPYMITSYADLRWGNGNVYGHIGFKYIGNTVPGYWYVRRNEIKRHHRYTLRKKASEPKNIPERILRIQEGWNTIWDCGHARWDWYSEQARQFLFYLHIAAIMTYDTQTKDQSKQIFIVDSSP